MNLNWVMPAEGIGRVECKWNLVRCAGIPVASRFLPSAALPKGVDLIVEIHCAPNPPGNEGSRYAHVEAAIAEAEKSGLHYEVGALGTTIEGTPDELWALLRSMHEATLNSGAASVITNIRIAQRANDEGLSMTSLVAPYRQA